MRWPTEKMPDAGAPPIRWARWYRDVMGWIVLPTRCQKDLDGFYNYLMRGARARALDDAGRDPTDDELAKMQAAAWNEVGKLRKAPLVHWLERTSVSNADIETWWGSRSKGRGEHRGIWIPMGRLDVKSTAHGRGLVVAAIDVDPRAGGSVEEWSAFDGPLAETPSGGVHVLCSADRALACSVGIVSPGVDVRASGGGIVAPSGSATPGRVWKRWTSPQPPPESVIAARPGDRIRGEGGSGIEGSTATGSTFAEMLGLPAPDGTRQATAAAIIGILARPSSIPEDSVGPALALLKTAGEEDIDEWRRLLTRGPRDVEVAVSFILAWNNTLCDPAWSEGAAEKTARSLWKTADRREGGNAGAEDYGVGDAWDPSGMPAAAVVDAEEDGESRDATADSPEDDQGMETVGPGSTDAAEATPDRPVLKVKKKPFEIPEGFCIPLSVAYPFEKMEERTLLEPISVAHGPKWKRWDGADDTTAEFGYGLGTWFDDSVGGGIAIGGAFWAVGALTAKAGKTMFLGQLVEGLALASAERLLTKKDGPIILPFWLTEMQKHVDVGDRMMGRFLNIDMSMWGRGIRGHEAPGIKHMAIRMPCAPEDAAKYAVMMAKNVLSTENVFSVARSLTVNLDPQRLPPKRGGRGVENPRLGLKLLKYVEAAVKVRVEEVAKQWGIDKERIIPLLIADPVHRFVDAAGEDRLTAVNLVIHALREIAFENGWIAMATSDTTKAGAAADKAMDGDPAALASAAFAGSQNLAHEPDTVIVLHAEQGSPPPGGYIATRPVQVRVCLCRRGGGGPPLPYIWHTHNGRYIAVDPTLEATGAPMDKSPAGAVIKRGRRGRPRKGS